MNRLLQAFFLVLVGFQPFYAEAKGTIAKQWNEELLKAIRNSRARPTVHARNLYHWSVVAYDARAAYHPDVKPYLLGDTLRGVPIPFKGVPEPDNVQKAQREAISYASYRLMMHRYQVSPKFSIIQQDLKQKMASLGYPIADTATTYWDGDPAHLGNYIAKQMIQYGLQDGAHEKSNYSNQDYIPVNDTLNISNTGTPGLRKPNHWQPLQITQRKDQAGNPIKATQSALSPEWGDVDPFALADSNYVVKTRKRTGADYKVWLDPGPPPYLDTSNPGCIKSEYKWNFCMVSIWQSHLDPADTTTYDISPGNLGNLQSYPQKFKNYDSYYNYFKGGSAGLGKGYDTNPVTGQPYQPQMVKRADYARILAEYWADGIASETPPGHWYAIYNEIEVKPGFDKKWKGQTPLTELAYDLRTYLALGGAVHDAAVAAWSVKGWYDYVRPVSAIRNMAKQGQCTDPNKRNYDPDGIPLIKDYIEVIQPGDPLAGQNNQNVGEIKLYTWKGPDFVKDVKTDTAGVGWILAGNWWPYQKPSFVTPPFPGYVSGHSTFSQAAAKVMAKSTGSPYFPGGKSDFLFKKNEFLTHENGPTEDVVLEYATYKDAADWTALSRIWGGIHPPADDINGRIMGQKAGRYAFNKADSLFSVDPPVVDSLEVSDTMIARADFQDQLQITFHFNQAMKQLDSLPIKYLSKNPRQTILDKQKSQWLTPSTYQITYKIQPEALIIRPLVLHLKPIPTMNGGKTRPFLARNPYVINTKFPQVERLSVSDTLITDSLRGETFSLKAHFSEPMDTTGFPGIELPTDQTLKPDSSSSRWLDNNTFQMTYSVVDRDADKSGFKVRVTKARDAGGNKLSQYDTTGLFRIAMSNPVIVSHALNKRVLNYKDRGETPLVYELVFDRPMDTDLIPRLRFKTATNLPVLVNNSRTKWLNDTTCRIAYRLLEKKVQVYGVEVQLKRCRSALGNPVSPNPLPKTLGIDTKKPRVDSITLKAPTIALRHQNSEPYSLTLHYSESMDVSEKPVVFLSHEQSLDGIVSYDLFTSNWVDSQRFKARFQVKDSITSIDDIDLRVNFGEDRAGNNQVVAERAGMVNLDTERPKVAALTATQYELGKSDQFLSILTVYNKVMDTAKAPGFAFNTNSNAEKILIEQPGRTHWITPNIYKAGFRIKEMKQSNAYIDLSQFGAVDKAGNPMDTLRKERYFSTVKVSGHEALASQKPFKLYPNPLSTGGKALHISTDVQLRDVHIQLYDQKGKLVYQEKAQRWSSGEHKLQWRTKKQRGLFHVRLRSLKHRMQWQLVVLGQGPSINR